MMGPTACSSKLVMQASYQYSTARRCLLSRPCGARQSEYIRAAICAAERDGGKFLSPLQGRQCCFCPDELWTVLLGHQNILVLIFPAVELRLFSGQFLTAAHHDTQTNEIISLFPLVTDRFT